MTTLSVAVDADDKLWTVDTLPDPEVPYLEAGDELVEVSAYFPEHVYKPTMTTIPAKIRVVRAVAGTSAASHNQGITLTPVYPESATGGGGGAIAVTDGTTTIEDVTTLNVPGGSLSEGGPGSAEIVFSVNGSVAEPLFYIDAQSELVAINNDLGEIAVNLQGSQMVMGATSEMPSSLDLRTNRVGFAIANGAPFRVVDANSGDPLFEVQPDGSVHIKTGTSIIADL
ncbi:MAG TPA: hypothetical protein VJT72_07775 [Pseudonocardiaceae bacterium]|nr:hypothetical protein [Pseudonocardiaceae bacterium]